MNRLRKLLRIALLKTIWVNFYCLPIRQAVKLPILLAKGIRISSIRRGSIQFIDNQYVVRLGMVRIGFQDLEWSYNKKSLLNIQGVLVIKGDGYHTFSPGLSLAIAPGAKVVLGNNFSCSHNNRITIFKSLIVGDNNMWSFDNIIMDTDAHCIYNNKGEMISHNADIIFGDHVWLGCRNVILKGVSIPDGSIIGAGGIVTKSLPKENAIYVGNKMIKEGVSWNIKQNYE